ncbi:hypothetical protein F2P47_04115 [Parvibaculum sedimenti]|uniref:Uncharacterized protein n=1 Tax=Parvibaculum sedimenti TaxID=2608632 RepID=A0A6N6VQV3_9HYPH|nr:hypothetical protein [Parvibaculum sedimenti]KAB7741596.1 hypothetical protein F2P47_04115 [Parvibaculum sedimenti]
MNKEVARHLSAARLAAIIDPDNMERYGRSEAGSRNILPPTEQPSLFPIVTEDYAFRIARS